MAKVKMSNKDIRLKKEIEYAMAKSGFTCYMLADAMHITRMTLYRKLNNPSMLTVRDLRDLHNKVGFTADQLDSAL